MQEYKKSLLDEFEERELEYFNVYSDVIDTDSMTYYFDSYTLHGIDPDNSKYVGDMHFNTLLCYDNALQMRINFFNHWQPDLMEKPKLAAEMAVGHKKNMFKFLSQMTINQNIYGFNLPQPIEK